MQIYLKSCSWKEKKIKYTTLNENVSLTNSILSFRSLKEK